MSTDTASIPQEHKISLDQFRAEVLRDYTIAVTSREVSLMGRREVLTGKAKFGIFGDGKELPQIALAKAFRPGDWRSGYYRDQTWMMALGELTAEQFFAQLYANPDPTQEPASAGRQMNGHFATALQDADGNWLDHSRRHNVAADASPTASQMPRSLGIALASKLYRRQPALSARAERFTSEGDEVSFVSIGDASTSEGLFWETVNAAGVMRVPLAVCVWDDGYGISVPKSYQTTKSSISEALAGMATDAEGNGVDIYVCEGWNYPKLVATFKKGVETIRETHRPALFHITEVTQPQGHSTSGSHERYKNAERLQWEKDYDGIKQFRDWILSNQIADETDLTQIEESAKKTALDGKSNAWSRFNAPLREELHTAITYMEQVATHPDCEAITTAAIATLRSTIDPVRRDIIKSVRTLLFDLRGIETAAIEQLRAWITDYTAQYQAVYSSHLYSETEQSALRVKAIKPTYSENSKFINGFEILNAAFDYFFTKYPEVVAFGEDVGKIGDVNQGFNGIQEKYGEERIFDTGIREATIMGQAIGLAMRGFRPIAEIQYLDYLLYGLQPLSDDAATLHYRTRGIQRSPIIVRTRGHRLEGIWHTGSPMGMIVHALRGMHVCVPRDMTQAVGMYNTLLQSDEPALVVECLNGYRLKERLPDNMGEYTVPLGMPEVLIAGTDVTLVTYGSCVRVAMEAITKLEAAGISVELVDVQTLLPFDIQGIIGQSVRRTNRLIILDEDVPGGASAYIFQQVMEHQDIYRYLDSPVRTLTAAAHRAPYGSDGDYFSKPNVEQIITLVYDMMREVDPGSYPAY